jgi:hypothetical protein
VRRDEHRNGTTARELPEEVALAGPIFTAKPNPPSMEKYLAENDAAVRQEFLA